jgi:hypothetical protein
VFIAPRLTNAPGVESDIVPIWFASPSLNHRFASGPMARPSVKAWAVGSTNSASIPVGLNWPIAFAIGAASPK